MKKCQECKYFYPYGDPDDWSGQCRRKAPNPEWPSVFPEDWCGDQEDKIKMAEADQ